VLQSAASPNDRPIIGILTQPLNVELLAEDFGLGTDKENRSYIAASYVKFVESAGARAVPLHYDASDADLTKLFQQINGVIFPGGGAAIEKGHRFREAAELMYNLALKANDKGDAFPIHGTCLGFQTLMLIAAQDDGALCRRCYDTEGTPLPLHLTAEAKTSRLFSMASSSLMDAVTTQNITENSHTSGVDPKTVDASAKLKDFFQVLSTNVDSRGKSFVSTVEAKKYPISATQWHPEKNNFEWGKIGKLGYEAIPHSLEAVQLSQYLANDFVNRSRQSMHRFASLEAENEALIYNKAPEFDPQGYFQQIYLWEQPAHASRPLVV
jgi:gamma-glutamyl hydrolase